ncbi:MAG: ABC transporter permease [Candidatus Binatia bacterium]
MNKDKIIDWIRHWYSVFVILGIWELISHSDLVPRRLMPTLPEIGEAFWDALVRGDLLFHSGATLARAFAGFFLALAAGITLGALMARKRLVRDYIEPFFTFGYPVPKIALYPIFIYVLGLGSGSKIALIFLECLYPITIYTYTGIRSVERTLIWAGQSMGARERQIFWKVLIPSAGPTIFSGVRIALPVALIVVIMTELIGESVGLGFFITYAASLYDYARSFAGLLAVVLMGFLLDRLLITTRRHVFFWQSETVLLG